jgi:RNA polymerase sigma-70 factor (ECF subfamily)
VVKPEGKPDTRETDWSLLERVTRKDEAALSELYDRYCGLVYSEVKRILRDTGAAEEILQDLFYQVWRTADRFDANRGSFAGWVLVAARNRAISKLRKKGDKGEELENDKVDLKVNLETSTQQSLLVQKIRAVLGSLPEGQREALECAYFEGMTHTEIAEKTGQPLGTVKTRIRMAMETLKKVLS